MKNVSTTKLIGALVVIVAIAAVIIIVSRSHSSAPVVSDMDSTQMASSTDMTSASSTEALVSQADLVYEVATAKKSYSQNEQFDIFVTVLNNTDEAKNFNFKDGCQGDYTIGSFDMIKHTRCLPDPTLFTVQPHDKATVKLTYYPSIVKIPAGNYTLHAEIIGYGGSNIPITITN